MFTVPFLGPSGGTKNGTAKSQNQPRGRTQAQNKDHIYVLFFQQQTYKSGTVALLVAISRTISIKIKASCFFNRAAKNVQNSIRTRSQKAVPFLGPHAEFSKEIKKKHVHGPIFGTVWRYQKWDRKIAKSTAWADPSTKQRPYLRFVFSATNI